MKHENSTRDAELALQSAEQWWTTAITDITPGSIRLRGYPIEQLIGKVSLVDTIWLMLRGELPSAAQSALLEAAMVASVDHGPQAPSIAISRMAVTCGLSLNGAVASAVNVLGDVHGGAGEQALRLYRAIDAEVGKGAPLAAATAAVCTTWQAENGRHLPGFGHRFHPIDPRTPRLLALGEAAAAAGTIDGRFLQIARAVENYLGKDGKRVPMNIDGVTAAIYGELGFDAPLARGLFVLSRGVGILAHAWEQSQMGGRIKGPMPTHIPYHYSGVPARDVQDDQP
ncbi:MAG: citryl-CoA lyase [Pigmentiphaga sp.]